MKDFVIKNCQSRIIKQDYISLVQLKVCDDTKTVWVTEDHLKLKIYNILMSGQRLPKHIIFYDFEHNIRKKLINWADKKYQIIFKFEHKNLEFNLMIGYATPLLPR